MKRLTGESMALDVAPGATVESVKAMIQRKDGTRPGEQRLLFESRVLKD